MSLPATHRVQVWNVRITTVEQPGAECLGSICDGCAAPCCRGIKIPLLTQAEAFSGRFPVRLLTIPELQKEVPNAENVVGLGVTDRGCPFLLGGRCTIYDGRPQSCRVYDCRQDRQDKAIIDFARERFDRR